MSDPVSIEHRHLRRAIEYAVLMGDEMTKRKAPIVVPREVRSASGRARIPTDSLGRLRRAIEADDTFRTVIAAGAPPELVDPVGMLWLQRPDGWEEQAGHLLAEMASDAVDADLRTALRREEKRRHAAEHAAVRLRAELAERDAALATLQADIDVIRADLAKADDETAALRVELVDVRLEARHARDREGAARARLDAVTSTADSVVPAVAPSPVTPPTVDSARLAQLAAAARDLARYSDELIAELTPDQQPVTPAREIRRTPMALPGGMIGSSAVAAEYLLRSDAAVLVDGYNVAKLAWPSCSLVDQRERLLDGLENLARRFGTDLTVLFDGASIVGAHATRRRRIRVGWSPEGVSADDVIRDEVRRLPTRRAVVVVTNDAAIVADVKDLGANVVPSNALIAVL